ncbi:DinB family protein [Isoptericola sp. b441]|uniref:DinB family protein n=1 Tax=Actinotalea lenta TaxID=3064654 RepID=A0ABT9D7V1_9CELL|nr:MULTISPECIES: DinB family protein [unclassified Isoptericola]MDO8106936.1 DinB family protein [Isoptericola sp. b441]MDO8121354.1 DinB family protein [Isoptericola sp. b490]
METSTMLADRLAGQRRALLAKLDGLSEYDARRPLVPSGTSLLGLVKHVAYIQLGYLGDCFGRPPGIAGPWDLEPDDPDADLWVPAGESRADVLDVYARSATHADATLAALPLDTVGHVPWWSEDRRHPTLLEVTVHLTVDVARHAGQADILREQLDGAIGYLPDSPNLPERDAAGWAAHHARVEAAARQAAGVPPA